MAIAFDAVSNASPGVVSSFSQAHTITGTNPWIKTTVVTATASAGSYVAGTAVNWNGTALTKLQSITIDFTGVGGVTFEDWYLKAPATGTHNINVTLASAPANGTGSITQSYTGVDQTNPIDSNAINASSFNFQWDELTTVVQNNCWLVGFCWFNVSSTAGANSAQTVIRYQNGGAMFGDSGGIVGTGSKALSWINNVSTELGAATISIAAAGAGGGSTATIPGPGRLLPTLPMGLIIGGGAAAQLGRAIKRNAIKTRRGILMPWEG